MPDKPRTASGYHSDQLELVKGTCLFLARILHDLKDDFVIVGGLVPTLLIDQQELPEDVERHVGTNDLDVGLAVAILDERRYQTLTERLRQSGFAPDVNPNGNPVLQRWKYEGTGRMTIDFLISPPGGQEPGGTICHLEQDFGAIVLRGLPLAFRDFETRTLRGYAINGSKGSAEVRVCGPGAFVVLKALAFKRRNANKDAYDLYYVLRNYGTGVADVAARLAPLLDAPEAREAMDALREHFQDPEGFGPSAASEFTTGGMDDAVRADVVAYVDELLRTIARSTA